MPTAAVHSKFWASRVAGSPPAAPGASSGGGYVPWQMNIIAGSGFGVTQAIWEWLVKKATTTWPKPSTP